MTTLHLSPRWSLGGYDLTQTRTPPHLPLLNETYKQVVGTRGPDTVRVPEVPVDGKQGHYINPGRVHSFGSTGSGSQGTGLSRMDTHPLPLVCTVSITSGEVYH